jgi:hypothetical protein
MDKHLHPNHVVLNPFNYFEWKFEITLSFRSKGLYRITMGTKVEPMNVVEKQKYYNRMNEAFGMICLSISRDFMFHVDTVSSPNGVWTKLGELFGKQDELRAYSLDNELIGLNPSNFDSLQEYFTKFKSLLVQLKDFKVVKKYEKLIISILSKLGPDYSVSVSSFHALKLTTLKWKMPYLDDFIEELTEDHEKLVSIGSINGSIYNSLVANEARKSNFKDQKKGKGKNPKARKEKFLKTTDESSSDNKGKKKEERYKFLYFEKGYHPEDSFVRETIDEMVKMLQQNNHMVSANARKKDEEKSIKGRGKYHDGHAFMVVTSSPYTWILDLGSLNHMALKKQSFSSVGATFFY